MNSSDSSIADQLLSAVRGDYCVIFPHKALRRQTENSDIQSSPIVNLSDLLSVTFGKMSLGLMQVGFHHIVVNGPRELQGELHFHISPVIGFVAVGVCKLHHMKDDVEVVEDLSPGDMFVFPKDALHLLSTEEGKTCTCVTIEWGPALDYQRHHL